MIFKNLGWAALQQWGQQGSQVLVLFIVAGLIGPKALGLLAFANLFIQVAQMLINQGYAESLIQSKELTNRHINSIFWRMMLIAFGIFAVFTTAGGMLAWFEIKGDLGLVLLALAPAVFFRPAAYIQTSLAGREMQFKEVAKASLLSSLAGDLAAIYLAWHGWGVWSLVVSQHIKNLLLNLLIRRVTKWQLRLEYDRQGIRDVEHFSSRLFGTNLLGFIANRADQLIVGAFLGFEALGIYGLVMRLMLMIEGLLMSALNRVFFSVFSKLQEKKAVLLELYYAMQDILCSITYPAFVGLAVVGPILLPALLGPEWSKAGAILPPLSLLMIIKSTGFLFYPLQLSAGRSDALLKASAISAFLMLTITLSTVSFGLFVLALGVAARNFLTGLSHLYYVNTIYDFDSRRLLKICVVRFMQAGLMGAGVYALQNMFSAQKVVLTSTVVVGLGIALYILLFIPTFGCTLKNIKIIKHYKSADTKS